MPSSSYPYTEYSSHHRKHRHHKYGHTKKKKHTKHTRTSDKGVKLVYKNITDTLPLTRSGRVFDPAKTHPATFSKSKTKKTVKYSKDPATSHPATYTSSVISKKSKTLKKSTKKKSPSKISIFAI